MNATQTTEKTKAVNDGQKFDQKLADAILEVVTTNHKYVNPTLKRLATSAGNRLAKLQSGK